MRRAKELARERLDTDLRNAIRVAAFANAARNYDNAGSIISHVRDIEQDLIESIFACMDRNWSFAEKARGERTAT